MTFETIEIFVTKGPTDTSCETVCQQQHSTCAGEHEVQLINTCDELRQYFPCEAGCYENDDEENDKVFPGYVSNRASKEDNPAACYTSSALTDTIQKRSSTLCQAKSGPVERLCVCSRSGAPQNAVDM